MFGYIKAYKPEMKIKEYEIYRGIYCSLCKQIGKDYGLLSRFFLNYDFTFLALCRMSVNENAPAFHSSHCSFNCAKKCVCCEKDQEDLRYSAAVSEIMVFHKVKDNMRDGSFFKKLIFGMIYPYAKRKYNKASAKFPDVAAFVEQQMTRQNEIENGSDFSIDLASDPSGCALGYVMSYGFDGEEKEALRYFGYSIGRLIYISDAADDIESDKKSGSFNPFILNDKYKDNVYIKALELLEFTGDEIAKTFELLPVKRFKSIIGNIIYYGFEREIKRVTKEKGCENERSL